MNPRTTVLSAELRSILTQLRTDGVELTMALDPTEIRLGISGHVYSAPIGTAFPADAGTAPGVGWVEHGYLTEDGISVAVASETTDIMAWQSLTAVRTVRTSQEFTATFALMQVNSANLKLAFGGGTIVAAGTGTKFTPPAASAVDERAFMLEVTDGAVVDRYCIARGLASMTGEVTFTKDEASAFTLSVKALTAADGSTYTRLTNDANVTADV